MQTLLAHFSIIEIAAAVSLIGFAALAAYGLWLYFSLTSRT